jgi:hypothetical protein
MASWYLVPCLKELFAEFDRIAPGRDHASDGSIGDATHQQNPTSDHNPDSKGAVHAIDVDNNLNASFSMEDVIQYFVAECRKNNPNGTDRGRLKYFIYNRRIWSASTGWKQENYTGSSAHTEHAHFSCEYAPEYEKDTASWGLVERFGDDVSEQDVTNALNKFFAVTKNESTGNLPDSRIGHDAGVQRMPGSPFSPDQLMTYQYLGKVGAAVMDVKAMVAELAGKDFTDETAIVQGVLAGLAGAEGAAETIADAVVNALPPDLAQQVVDEMAKRLAPPTQP